MRKQNPETVYELRRTTQAALPILYEIYRSAMANYVTAVWGWDEEDQARRFRDYFSTANLQVIRTKSNDIGFLDLATDADDIYVANIEIAPAYQGQGIGTAIMRDVIAQARRECRSVKLQVLKVNLGATRFYQRLGFVVWNETPIHCLMTLDPTSPR